MKKKMLFIIFFLFSIKKMIVALDFINTNIIMIISNEYSALIFYVYANNLINSHVNIKVVQKYK